MTDYSGGSKSFVDLANYARAARRFWSVVLGVAVLGGILGLLAYSAKEPAFRSTAVVQVFEGNTSVLTPTTADTPVINMANEQVVARSTNVTEIATKTLGTGLSATEFQERTTATAPDGANTLTLTFTGTTPDMAQKGAQAWADAYLANRSATFEQRRQTEIVATGVDSLETQLTAAQAAADAAAPDSAEQAVANAQVKQLTQGLAQARSHVDQLNAVSFDPGIIITEPVLPTSKEGLPKIVYLMVGALIGAVLGGVAAIVLERFIGRVRTVADVRPIVGPLAWAAGRLGTRAEAPGVASVALRMPTISNGRHTTIVITDLDNRGAVLAANSLANALQADDVSVDIAGPNNEHPAEGTGVHLVVAPNVLDIASANAMARSDGVVLVVGRGTILRQVRAAMQVVAESDCRLLATLVAEPPIERRLTRPPGAPLPAEAGPVDRRGAEPDERDVLDDDSTRSAPVPLTEPSEATT